MIRLLYITLILLVTNCDVYAQTAYANITAIITTPVGMEISSEINSSDFSVINNEVPGSDSNINANRKVKPSLVNIIGKTFSHTVTVEKYNELRNTDKSNGSTFYSVKNNSFVKVTVNFD
jgi:hypothetical protein